MSGPDRDDPAQIVGQVLLGGKLEVIRLLGAGGMGAVYEVVHRMTRHHRALKVLHAEYALRAEVVARFLREATVAGTLNSSHVVETYDAGQLEDGSPYVLMEMLEGESLGEAFERGPIGTAQIVEIVRGACEGLAIAHAEGIVHRDIKPDNLFLTRDEDGETRVKLLDFGISKFAAGHDFAGELTSDGEMMGTPFYMSPEQARGAKDVDARADIYALGVILYEALAGKPPFMADSLPALVVQIYEGDFEPLSETAPGIRRGLMEVVEKAMHRDLEQRYQSAEELREALAPYGEKDTIPSGAAPEVAFDRTLDAQSLQPPPPQPEPAEAPGGRRAWVGVAVGALLVALGAGAWLALGSEGTIETPPVTTGAPIPDDASAAPEEPEPTESEPSEPEPDEAEPPTTAPGETDDEAAPDDTEPAVMETTRRRRRGSMTAITAMTTEPSGGPQIDRANPFEN